MRKTLSFIAILVMAFFIYRADPIVIVKKTDYPIEVLQQPKTVEVVSPVSIYKPVDFNYIHPSDIPESKRWLYRGENLKMHIYITHGIELERMRYLSQNDLIKLHSYLHNGGRL